MKKIIALAALVAVSATASAATNLFTNGSFEDNVLASGTWNTFQSVDGWLVTTASGAKSPHGLEIRNNVAGTAQDGNNFIELDGYENDRITTAFATTIGQEYQITFWYADRDGVAADSEGFTARVISGSLSPAYTKGAVGAPGWVEETIDFTAGSDLSIFTIKADGKSDSLGTSFDNFQAIAVPEPATLGMFAAGLAMLGLSARRRSK
jgi:hypothetical protein